MFERTGHSFLEIMRRRSWVAIFAAIVGAAVVCGAVMFVHVKYTATSHVLLVNDATGRDPAAAGLDMPTIATSTSVISDVKQKLGLSASISEIQRGVTARVAPRSSIMTIGYRGRDPGEAVAISNGVADAFVAFYTELPMSRSRAVTDSLASDLASTKLKVVDLERRVEKAAAGQSYVGTQVSLDNVGRELGELRAQRGAAYAQLVSDRMALANAQSQPAKLATVVRHEILENDKTYHDLSSGVAHDESAYAMYRASVTDKFPGIADYKAKLAGEESALSAAWIKARKSPDAYSPSQAGQVVELDRARATVAGDEAHVAAIDTQIAEANGELASAGSVSGSSLGALRAQRDAAEAQFQALTLRYSNAQSNAAESSSLGRAVVIDRAVKADASLLGPNVLLILGLLGIAALAIAAAYAAEALDPRLVSPIDIENVYGSPSLGTLGKN